MQIYYINLARRTDRRAFMEAQFDKLGLEATRIEAVTPDTITDDERRSYCDPAHGGPWITPPELGSCKSHLLAMARLIASEEKHALILEDDAILSGRLPRFLASYDRQPPPVDLLNLEAFGWSMRLASIPLGAVAGIAIHRLWSEAFGVAGYIIARRAAERASASREMRTYPADNALLDPYGCLSGLVLAQAAPALVIQADRVPGYASEMMHSDLSTRNSRKEAEAPYRLRRLPGRIRAAVKRELLDGPRKAWHGLVDGAKRRSVAFVE
jgi:glycosyl transferase, family 25